MADFTPQKVMAMMGMDPMGMAMMASGPMMPPPFPGAPQGFGDMMSMGMFGGDMPGFPGPGMGGDDGAYGGSNIQGVAGVVANPHPPGFNRIKGNEGGNDPGFFNHNSNNQMRNMNNAGNMNNFQRNNNFGNSNAMNLTNGNNMNYPQGPSFQQNNNNNNNNWNRGNRGR